MRDTGKMEWFAIERIWIMLGLCSEPFLDMCIQLMKRLTPLNCLRISTFLLAGIAVCLSGSLCFAAELGVSETKPSSGIFVEFEGKFLVPYKAIIPGTDVTFDMVPVPGGKFLMGSPESEEGRGDDEGPQVEVEIAPFWMGKTELTWAEYKRYMGTYGYSKNSNQLVFARLQTAIKAMR